MPPQEQVPNSSMVPGKSNQKVVILIFLFVLLLGIFYFLLGTGKNKQSTQQKTLESINFTNIDLTKVEGADKIPKGMPQDLPLEINNVVESYTADYPVRGVVRANLTYTTERSVGDVYSEALLYMKNANYIFTDDGQNEENGYLSGTKNRSTLTFVVDSRDNKTFVQITYLDRIVTETR